MSTDSDPEQALGPIKIGWKGDARSKLESHYIESRLSSREDDVAAMAERAVATLRRQSTNVVINTEAEARALAHHLSRAVQEGYGGEGRVWTTPGHYRAFRRVHDELRAGMVARGWSVE